MFHEKQLAGRISACKWNDLFPWNLQDLKDIPAAGVCDVRSASINIW